MKKYRPIITTLIIIGIICGIGTCVKAYFTDSLGMEGTVNFAPDATKLSVRSNINGDVKNIVVEQTGKLACYVRVKILATSKEQYTVKQNAKWEYKADGYWYYKELLNNSNSIATLQVQNTNNVIAIVESKEAKYDEESEPFVNWEQVYTNEE